MSAQRTDRNSNAETMSSREPLWMTGRICWKSPPKTTVIPLKFQSYTPRMSLHVWSTASAACQCCMVISSQMMSLVAQISDASYPSLEIGQVESWWSDIGILNVEWAVRPPQRRSVAMLEDATHSTIHPLPWTVLQTVL